MRLSCACASSSEVYNVMETEENVYQTFDQYLFRYLVLVFWKCCRNHDQVNYQQLYLLFKIRIAFAGPPKTGSMPCSNIRPLCVHFPAALRCAICAATITTNWWWPIWPDWPPMVGQSSKCSRAPLWWANLGCPVCRPPCKAFTSTRMHRRFRVSWLLLNNVYN